MVHTASLQYVLSTLAHPGISGSLELVSLQLQLGALGVQLLYI